VKQAASEPLITLKRVQAMLGLSRSSVTGLIQAGFVAPLRGPGNQYRFSFQDLVMLRTAFKLQQASIPPRKILRALAKLRDTLPEDMQLTGIGITAVGADIAVRDSSGQWTAETGQLLMEYEVSPLVGRVAEFAKSAPEPSAPPVDWFRQGEALEPENLVAAEAAYRHAIATHPGHVPPYLNLGALLCEAGRSNEAAELYDRALATVGHDPLIHFNHAIALEDVHRLEEACAAYGRALALDRRCADAHFNLGVLLETQGDSQGALRHFSAYRRLTRAKTPGTDPGGTA